MMRRREAGDLGQVNGVVKRMSSCCGPSLGGAARVFLLLHGVFLL